MDREGGSASGLSSAQFMAAMEHSPTGTALVALDGRWLWTNSAIREILGYARDEFERLDFQAMTHPDDLGADLEQAGKLVSGEGRAYQMEKRYLRKDGSSVWCLMAVSLIRDADGAPDYFISMVQDISDRKAGDLERAALIERLELATKSSRVGVWEWDLATDRLIWNAQMYELTGISPQIKPEYGMFIALIDANHRERVDSILRQTIAGTAGYDTEFPLTAVGGDVRQLRATATLVRDSSGEPVRMIGTNWDVTAERRLYSVEQENNRFGAAIRAVQGVLWTNDATGRMVGEQPGWAALTGQGIAEYQDYGWAEAVHPDDAQPTVDAWNEAVAERKTFIFEHRVKRHDGAWRLFSIRAVPLLDPDDGSLLEWVGVHTDITDQREAEAQLRAANVQLAQVADEFRMLAEGMPELCWTAKPDGHIYWYNQHWYDYTGTTPAEMEGWGWQAVHDPAVLPSVIERWSESISTGQAFEMTFPLRGADGVFRPFLTRIAPVFDAAGAVLRWLGINIDVSEAEATNAELERRVEARTAELNAMAHELHKARHVAEDANRAKTRFLAG
ncbi:MAG: PAS domain S-box protein, partial [Sphingomicrobium sp.]